MSLVARGFDFECGEDILVVVGLLETVAGGVRVALLIGEDRPVILALQDASQLALNVNGTAAERLTITADKPGEVLP